MSTEKVTITQAWHGKEISVQARVAIGRTAYELGLIVEGQAKLLCPVDYGYLAASITTQSIDKGTELGTPAPNSAKEHEYPHDVATFKKIAKPSDPNQVLVGTPVDYGPYVEFGTVRSEAQPFLRPALDLARGKRLTILEKNGRLAFGEYLK